MSTPTQANHDLCGPLAVLGDLPPGAPLYVADLARLLGRHPKSIWRAARRGELPAPFRFMGRSAWTAGAILAHLEAQQDRALSAAGRRAARISRLAP